MLLLLGWHAAHSGPHPHPNIRSMMRRTVQEEGLRGLYRGVAPTLLGILPYSGIKFYVYQSLKQAYRTHMINAAALAEILSTADVQQPVQQNGEQPEQQPGTVGKVEAAASSRLPVWLMLVFGGVSGLVAQTITYPLDVVRRQMQVQGMAQLHAAEIGPPPCSSGSRDSLRANNKSGGVDYAAHARGYASTCTTAETSSRVICNSSTGSSSIQQDRAYGAVSGRQPAQQHLARLTMLQTAKDIVAVGGWMGFVRGLSINYLKVVPSTAVGFTIYDAMKSYLDVASNL